MVAKTQEGVERYYYELRKKLSDFDGAPTLQPPPTTPAAPLATPRAPGVPRYARVSM